MKTGHTEASGYGLVSSVERNGRRLILVVNGLQSARARGDESERLLQYGFREFKTITLYQRGDVVTDATVWTGDSDQVSLVAARDFTVSIPRRANKSISMKAVFEQPLPAPLSQGSQAGVLHLSAEDMPETAKLPLLVGSDVERLGAFGRLISAAHYYVVGR